MFAGGDQIAGNIGFKEAKSNAIKIDGISYPIFT